MFLPWDGDIENFNSRIKIVGRKFHTRFTELPRVKVLNLPLTFGKKLVPLSSEFKISC